MKNRALIIAFILAFCLSSCKGSDKQETRISSIETKNFINIEKILDTDSTAIAMYLNWQDVIKADILESLFEIIDNVADSAYSKPVNVEKIIKEFMNKMNLDFREDIHDLLVAFQFNERDIPQALFIVKGNFMGKHRKIIDNLGVIIDSTFTENTTDSGLLYYTSDDRDMPVIIFPDENTFMLTIDSDSLDWGLGILTPTNITTLNNPIKKEMASLSQHDNTFWMIMAKPVEVMRYSSQQQTLLPHPFMEHLDYLYVDSKLAGKNSTQRMIMYMSDADYIESAKTYLNGYYQMSKGMYSNYPGFCQTFENVNFTINKENKSITNEVKFDFNEYWKDLMRMFNDMMPLFINQAGTR